MARIIYALSGQGRGHTSRVLAISETLRRNGHQVIFCGGGMAYDLLTALGESVIEIPAFRQTVKKNRLRLFRSAWQNRKAFWNLSKTVNDLAEVFEGHEPDLLITDFEMISPRAARRIKLPVISMNHQQVVTETRYRVPFWYRPQAAFASAMIQLVAPQDPVHVVLPSFFFPPVKDPERTTLVQPIIRRAVQESVPVRGEHVLVYYNHTEGGQEVLDQLRQVKASFVVYNFDPPERPEDYPNLHFREPSMEGFLKDLARSRAVVCTAGFSLISEALYLKKPLLVVPNRGLFEQTLNALYLQKEQLGEAVMGRSLKAQDVSTFLTRLDPYEARLQNLNLYGNRKAVACIESLLIRLDDSIPMPSFSALRASAGRVGDGLIPPLKQEHV